MTAEIVWGGVCSHTGAMMRAPKGEGEEGDRMQRVFSSFDALAESMHASGAEAVVMVGTDHFLTFDYANLPVFAVGTGTKYRGHGEFGVPQHNFVGVEGFGEAVHRNLLALDFDASAARDMPLDHAFACPLQLLFKKAAIPVLPVYVNCTVSPLPSLPRCLAFGKALGDAICAQDVVKKVAIIGTGGISHWVGTPQTGQINQEFDRAVLDAFVAGRFEDVSGYDSEKVIKDAGNGAAEIRNWLVAAGAVEWKAARLLAYEPVQTWSTGIGVMELMR